MVKFAVIDTPRSSTVTTVTVRPTSSSALMGHQPSPSPHDSGLATSISRRELLTTPRPTCIANLRGDAPLLPRICSEIFQLSRIALDLQRRRKGGAQQPAQCRYHAARIFTTTARDKRPAIIRESHRQYLIANALPKGTQWHRRRAGLCLYGATGRDESATRKGEFDCPTRRAALTRGLGRLRPGRTVEARKATQSASSHGPVARPLA